MNLTNLVKKGLVLGLSLPLFFLGIQCQGEEESGMDDTLTLLAADAAVNGENSILAGATGGGSSTGTKGDREWTYMVYMGADNNLSDAGVLDINEMETVGSSSKVAVVVQAEFSELYDSFSLGNHSTRRIYVEADGNTNSVDLAGDSLGNLDMGDPATLTAFIKWAAATYPANHYALVIWDHGAGWKKRNLIVSKGAVQDETSGSFMSLPDLAQAVSDSGTHLDIINFDACLMGMYEVAYEFNGLADYMVFSEETEPGDGDPYDTILGALDATPTMDGGALAKTIVNEYNTFYAASDREATTKSAIDMSKVEELDAKILALSSALAADSTTNSVVADAQTSTQNYAYPANHDIQHFAEYLVAELPAGDAKTAASELAAFIPEIVTLSKTTETSVQNSFGLAIYIPKASETTTSELAEYALLKSNTATRSRASSSGTWGNYIEGMLSGSSDIGSTVEGNFIVGIAWETPAGASCDADLDLYVSEPDGSWYAPWNGQTTPNGYFSSDSGVSGESQEYYAANSQVEAGYYDFMVNYFADGSCTQAKVYLYLIDPSTYSDSDWHLIDSETLDRSNPYVSGCSTLSCYDGYSDWWYPGWLERSISGSTFGTSDLPVNTKNSMIVTKKRVLPSLTH